VSGVFVFLIIVIANFPHPRSSISESRAQNYALFVNDLRKVARELE
jgi:hypothetical protein